ncbi:MAG TPA: serine hydrolase domain-containing protein [Gemmatimonadaceae bacterium]|jgi:CubicO group peptidase (beta-lactamase class C family)|nr:serine hydrolase domain-containing protein [Gemmatimonadaceae bacterium]
MSAVPTRVARFTPPSRITAAALVAGLMLSPARTVAAQDHSRIDRFLQSYVDSNRIGGAVVLVLRDGKVVHERAVGWADREAKRPMTADAIFRIASESKPVTSVAILQLAEAGKLSIDDPVSRWLPTYAKTFVASDAPGDSGRTLMPARRPIIIRDLITHTAGISYGLEPQVAARYAAKALGPGAGAGLGWYTADKDEPACATMERLGTLPFVAQPGERWVFGYNLDILGCVVERAAGMPLDKYVHDRITAPLGMNETYFFLPAGMRARLVAVYASDSTKHAARAPDGPRGQGNYVDGPRKNFAGGAGLLSTASDYSRFLEMIRGGGTLGGVRILSSRSVDLMTHNQIGARYGVPGQGFGFGFYTIDSLGADGPKSLGTFGWRGGYGTIAFVDPKEKLTVVFMINQIPNTADLAARLPSEVYAALLGR